MGKKTVYKPSEEEINKIRHFWKKALKSSSRVSRSFEAACDYTRKMAGINLGINNFQRYMREQISIGTFPEFVGWRVGNNYDLRGSGNYEPEGPSDSELELIEKENEMYGYINS